MWLAKAKHFQYARNNRNNVIFRIDQDSNLNYRNVRQDWTKGLWPLTLATNINWTELLFETVKHSYIEQ